MLSKIKDSLSLPEVQNISDLDDPRTTEIHAQIIRNKPYLHKIYLECYRTFGRVVENNPNGKFVELGSGGGFIKDVYPTVLATDIMSCKGLDFVFSAQDMPFEDASLDGIFMINVLHHIKNPQRFFEEARRCLKKDAQIIMIEPANTMWGRFIYTHFHHEPFDPKASDWNIPGEGPMSCANGALPWILFKRDKEKFNALFPELHINNASYHTPFRYLVSGGLSLKQLLPTFTYPLVKAIEWILTPLNGLLGMFMTVSIVRR